MTTTSGLDRAISAVDTTIETLRYDPAEPAGLSAVIGALRELCWHTTTLTTVLADAYDHHTGLGHDHGHDPAAAVTTITSGLHAVVGHLAVIDRTLADTHNTAAKLHRR